MRWKLESGKKKIVKRVQRYSKSSKEFKDIKIYWKDTQPNKWNLESWKGKIVKSKKIKDIGNTPSQLSRQWEEEISQKYSKIF